MTLEARRHQLPSSRPSSGANPLARAAVEAYQGHVDSVDLRY